MSQPADHRKAPRWHSGPHRPTAAQAEQRGFEGTKSNVVVLDYPDPETSPYLWKRAARRFRSTTCSWAERCTWASLLVALSGPGCSATCGFLRRGDTCQ